MTVERHFFLGFIFYSYIYFIFYINLFGGKDFGTGITKKTSGRWEIDTVPRSR